MAIVGVDESRKVIITDTGREIKIPEDVFKKYQKKAGRSEAFERNVESVKDTELRSLGDYEGKTGALGAAAGKVLESGTVGLIEKGEAGVASGIGALWKDKGQEKMSFLERFGENYAALTKGKQLAHSELDAQYQKAATAGTVAGVGLDIALGSKIMPAKGAIAAPLYGAGMDPTNIAEDPLKWVGNRAIDVAAGFGIDKAVSGLSSVAAQRAANKAHPGKAAAIEKINKVAKQANKAAEAETSARLRGISVDQQKSRRLYGNRVRKIVGNIGTEMSVSEIPQSAMHVEGFINDVINSSPITGTKEAKKLTNYFKAVVESQPEKMNWKGVAKVFNSIEDRIIVAGEEELPYLLKFKDHLIEVIPKAVGEASVKRKLGTRIRNVIIGDVDSGLNKLLKSDAAKRHVNDVLGEKGGDILRKSSNKVIKEFFGTVSNEELSYLIHSGELGTTVTELINNSPALKELSIKLKKGTPGWFLNESVGKEIETLVEGLSEKISTSVERFASDAYIEAEHTAGKVSDRLKRISGAAEPLPAPTQIPMQDIPEQEAMGFLGNLAEKPLGSFVPNLRGKGGAGNVLGGAATAAGVGFGMSKAPIVAGAAAAGTVAGVGGLGALKLATAPGKIGDITRKGISFFGKRLPSYLESKYESFEDGVLTNPDDRLEASIEIENDPYLRNQDKAVWQTKINKGQRI